MNQRSSLQAFTAAVLLLAAACSDQNEPVAPSTQPESPSFQPSIQGPADDPIALARAGWKGRSSPPFYRYARSPRAKFSNSVTRGLSEATWENRLGRVNTS